MRYLPKELSTALGKIKVELAQLRYQLSRLTGKGRDLSQTGGGIGTRGRESKKSKWKEEKLKIVITYLNRELQK